MRLFLLPLPLIAAACGAVAEPQPDPAVLERFLATLDAEQAPAAPLPGETRAKVERADRVVGTIEKVQTEKLDPGLAASVLGR